MDDKNGALSRRFSKAANMSFRDWAVQVRVQGAIRRMNERFEKCEPALTQARYRDLLTKQGASPELKPSYATEIRKIECGGLQNSGCATIIKAA